MRDKTAFYIHTYKDFYIDHVDDLVANVRSTKPHIHNTGELLIVEHGESTIAADDRIIHMKSPYMLYIPARLIHEQTNNPMLEYSRYCISIDEKYMDGEYELIPKSFFARGLDNSELEILLEYVRALYRHCGITTDGSGTFIRRRKYLLLLLLNELAAMTSDDTHELYPHKLNRQKRYIDDVCVYICSHSADKLSLDLLAERSFVSRAKLTHDFREAVNMSLGDYIAAVRVRQAKQLLQEDLPLAEVAQRCGYSSSGYFIKCFERFCGITPAKYREQIRSQDEVEFMITPDADRTKRSGI